MPIYSYRCRSCSHHFDTIVHGTTIPECPRCQATDLEKQLTTFAVGATDGGYEMASAPGPCGTCGDPRGPGACSLD
ncbi:MAG: zinc ribbon domain-containing protein [Nitrospirae bacterium]|nr:MAG: zinc ribbon domain-containing protein [Nitrospirota bacterium]